MTEPTHFEKVAGYVLGNDDSEIARVKAERDYALFSLGREIAICAETQRRLTFMEAKYGAIDWDAIASVSAPSSPKE